MGSKPCPKPVDHPPAPSTADQVRSLRAQIASLKATLDHQSRLATLGTIAGLIAHEFNNILTPVVSYSQLALAAPEDSDLARKALTKSLEGSERAAQIASAILGLIRDDRSAGFDRSSVPGASGTLVSEAVRRAVQCLARAPARDGIELTVGIPRETTVSMRGVALEHVLLNLMLNSRNAMAQSGGGTMTIAATHSEIRPRPTAKLPAGQFCSTWNTADSNDRDAAVGGLKRDDHGWVTIEITDSGRGMSEQRLGRLFEPFVSGDAWNIVNTDISKTYDSTTQPAGNGLGMTICKRLVDDVGGELAVWSQPGRGTRVWLILPAAPVAVPQAAPESEPLECATR